ncbi:inorganic polyphosphate kinase [Harryflintia acetispora]|uniref:Uncharacterized protein n=1 Tax=Harryflintia acetispora TaxID=1849041 RepID=A0A9X8Y838_9FIRM|nr:inorganic polyphosphate kinase [Harryflintia acetispora]TCL43233.1 hypothetical protein EDD78_10693 [Harryflintia acetispora]
MSNCSLQPYERTEWIDHLVDIITGAIIQQGTPINQRRLNNIEHGVEDVTNEVIGHCQELASMRTDLQTLKDAALNNMTNNVFVVSFDGLDSLDIQKGIFDQTMKRVYA